MKVLRIATIYNDAEQYQQMRDSFTAAGFTEANCTFEALDNVTANRYEPFSAYNAVQDHAEEPYIVFCHQDIRLDRGDGYASLMRLIEEMNRSHPDWAVLGNAGHNAMMDGFYVITDSVGDHEIGMESLPARVISLDENWLVVKRAAGVRNSTELQGFHLYGTDLCLNATRQGHGCYVTLFPSYI